MSEQKQYQIPHNFWDNGRIFNRLDKTSTIKMLVCLVPLTFIIFVLLPLRFDNKIFLEILLGAPITFLFAFGWDIKISDMLKFNKNRKVYYNLGKDVKYGKETALEMAYERQKKSLGYSKHK